MLRDSRDIKPPNGLNMKLSEAFTTYIGGYAAVYQNPSTVRQINYANKSIIEIIGDKDFCKLEEQDIILWQSKRLEQGINPNTIRGYTEKLRKVIKYHRARGVDCINPEVVYSPPKLNTVMEYLTKKEVDEFIRLAGTKKPGRSTYNRYKNKAIVATLYSTGLRISELCSLNKDDFRRGDIISLVGKGNKPRIVFVDERAKQAISEYLLLRKDANNALFVTHEGKRISPSKVRETFRIISKDFGSRVHPHSIRHAYATNLLHNGCHVFTLSRLMGHSSIQSTAKYLHVEDPELLEAHKRFHTF